MSTSAPDAGAESRTAPGLLGWLRALAMGWLLGRATAPVPEPASAAPAPQPQPRMPVHVFVVALMWMGLLGATFFVWTNVAAFRDFFPDKLGPLPVTTIWFGAAGGVLISLQGIYDHNAEWRSSYNYWHYTRPLLGALIGVLGCFVFIVLTNASLDTQRITPNATFYEVVALVIGYREQSFRTLVTRLTDTVLLPPDKPNGTGQGSGGAAPAATSTPAAPAAAALSVPKAARRARRPKRT